jgi:CspA family cold shock protein
MSFRVCSVLNGRRRPSFPAFAGENVGGSSDRRKTPTLGDPPSARDVQRRRGRPPPPAQGLLTICIFRAKDLFAKIKAVGGTSWRTFLLWRDNVATGTVKWFNSTKGFGFIQPQGGGPDVFVHISAVERAGLQGLNEGQQVDYELVTGRNGKASAENLKTK